MVGVIFKVAVLVVIALVIAVLGMRGYAGAIRRFDEEADRRSRK
ncbi:hypothetical protein ACKVEX_04225 [Rhodocyclaceae bacterium SMB388]